MISYNPGYQSVLKDLKQSTKQRFMAIEFDYPAPDVETTVVEREAGLDVTLRPAWSNSAERCGTSRIMA